MNKDRLIRLVTRNVNVLKAIFYMTAQCAGVITGAGILYGLTPYEAHGLLGVTTVHAEMTKGQAFGVEFMITFIMVFTFFANLDPKRSDMGSRSLSTGLSVTLGQLFAIIKLECQVNKTEHFRYHLLFAFNRGVKATETAHEI
eukprot:XP_014777377.1 PREDICTED: aquaporin-4-like [Octopus bimaculoides]